MASDLSHPTCAALFCRFFGLRFRIRRLHDPRPPPRPTHASRQLAKTPHDRRCEARALPAFAARSRDGRVWCLVHTRKNLPRLSPHHCDAQLSPDVHHLLGDRCRLLVLGMRPEQARVVMMPVAGDFTIANADGPSSDCVPNTHIGFRCGGLIIIFDNFTFSPLLFSNIREFLFPFSPSVASRVALAASSAQFHATLVDVWKCFRRAPSARGPSCTCCPLRRRRARVASVVQLSSSAAARYTRNRYEPSASAGQLHAAARRHQDAVVTLCCQHTLG